MSQSEKDVMQPRAAGRYIAERSLDVKVSQDGVEKTAKRARDIVFHLLENIVGVIRSVIQLYIQLQFKNHLYLVFHKRWS